MTKTVFVSILLLLFISSCKVTEKDIIGLYKLDRIPKTTLKINADKTFEFSRNNRNPYLYSSDHPDEYYINTKGTWLTLDKKTISLTSQSDTLAYPLVSVETLPAKNKDRSYFTFFDTYGDTVKILYVHLNDNGIVAAMHGSMDFYTMDLASRDTLVFYFYGYRPYTFINGQKLNQDFNILLKPAFQPNFFQETVFKIKRKQLIDVKRKVKFKQTKSGM